MSSLRQKNAGINAGAKLPQHQNRNVDGHEAYDTSERHARRMSIKNSTGDDPFQDEQEFKENLREFGRFDEE